MCGLPLGGLLDVSPGGVVVHKIERSCTGPAQRNGCARMDERGTIAAGDDQGLVVVELAELYRLCVQCAAPTVVLVVLLSDGVEKLVVSAFLVDMHDCSLVLPGGDDKKDIVAHPAPRAPSIRVQLLVAQSSLSGWLKA